MQKAYANRISYWGSHSRTVGDEMRVLKFTPPHTNLIINKLQKYAAHYRNVVCYFGMWLLEVKNQDYYGYWDN